MLALNEWSVHEAVHVQRFSDDVTFYTNGESPIAVEQWDLLKSRNVQVRRGVLSRLEGHGTSLERLVFTDGTTATCQALYCQAPTRQRSDLASRLGCRLFDDGAVEVNAFGQTTRPGVFAVGDMARTAAFPFAARQVIMAAAAGTVRRSLSTRSCFTTTSCLTATSRVKCTGSAPMSVPGFCPSGKP